MMPPGAAVWLSAVLVPENCGGGHWMDVTTVWLRLFDELGSVCEVATVAAFWMLVPQAALPATWKATRRVALWPLARVMLSQTTLPSCCRQRGSDWAGRKVRLAGI